jgi:hypothetical protein
VGRRRRSTITASEPAFEAVEELQGFARREGVRIQPLDFFA